VIAGFEGEAVERGSAALILATHGRANAEELVSDLADRVDGLVVMGRTVSNDVAASLDRRGVPVVMLARPSIGAVPAVRTPSLALADALTRHVLDHDRRHVVFVGDPDISPDVAERWQGVRRALRRAGRSLTHTRVPCEGFDVEHGYKAGLALFESPRPVDAIMCANDEVAAGVSQAATASGRAVPADVAITGWDDTPVASRLHPPLTTVAQPMHELGRRAAALLFDRIDGVPATSVVLRSTIVVRESCGCNRPARTGRRRSTNHAGTRPTRGMR
jgi:LacI family transcriptional regulator